MNLDVLTVEAEQGLLSSDDELPQDDGAQIEREDADDVIFLGTSTGSLKRTASMPPIAGAKVIDLAEDSDEPKVSLRGQPRNAPETPQSKWIDIPEEEEPIYLSCQGMPTLEWCFDNILKVENMTDRLSMMSAYSSSIRTHMRAKGLMPRIKRAKRSLQGDLEEEINKSV